MHDALVELLRQKLRRPLLVEMSTSQPTETRNVRAVLKRAQQLMMQNLATPTARARKVTSQSLQLMKRSRRKLKCARSKRLKS